MGFDNLELRIGDGYKGWPEEAPFDRIILTAAPPELPDTLVKPLAPGGRLITPVGETTALQRLVIVTKDAEGRIVMTEGLGVRFVPMVRPGDR